MKVAVSIPDDLFDAAERASAKMRVPRSRLYAEAIRAYVKAHSGEAVTRRLNEVYARETSALDTEGEKASLEVLRKERW